MSSPEVSSGASSPLRLAANRRNAQKSTGPKSAAGKRRVALNGLRRGLCSEEFENRLRARGQDPREFCNLHRDLIAILRPRDDASFGAVELLARTWWEKAYRIRNSPGAGMPDTAALDAKIHNALRLLVRTKRMRRERWRTELSSVLGQAAIRTPAMVRAAVEARLTLFGAKPGRRTYPSALSQRDAYGSAVRQPSGDAAQVPPCGMPLAQDEQAKPNPLRLSLNISAG